MEKTLQSQVVHSEPGNALHAKPRPTRVASRSRLLTLFLLAAAGFAIAGNANAYKFTDLSALTGTTHGYGADINNAGQVAGIADGKAVRWDGTSLTELGTLPGASGCYASAINKAGQIAGGCQTSTGRAVVWNGTTPTDLGSPDSSANGINNAGKVVGSLGFGRTAALWTGTNLKTLGSGSARDINSAGHVVGDNRDGHAFLWDGSTQIDLGTLGGTFSLANAINDAGTIVGRSLALGDGYSLATVWDGTGPTDLGSLWDGGVANDINKAGLIVGESYRQLVGGGSTSFATLWNDTGPINLNNRLDAATRLAGWSLRSANGINDKGWITGLAFNKLTKEAHAYVLSGVPEPQTYALMLAGLGVLALAARRRRAAD